jgi:hypothetical protein
MSTPALYIQSVNIEAFHWSQTLMLFVSEPPYMV